VYTTTLQEPSNGPALAVEMSARVQAANAVARVTARKDLMSMGDPRVGLMAPPPYRWRRFTVGVCLSFTCGRQSRDSPAARRGMVSRRRAGKEGVLLAIPAAEMGPWSTNPRAHVMGHR